MLIVEKEVVLQLEKEDVGLKQDKKKKVICSNLRNLGTLDNCEDEAESF